MFKIETSLFWFTQVETWIDGLVAATVKGWSVDDKLATGSVPYRESGCFFAIRDINATLVSILF